jgi:hypothetical protein
VTRNVIPDDRPLREELETLVRHYHHLQNEHTRAAPESSIRRRLEERLLHVRERFDRVLEEWVPDEELRAEWRDHLHSRAPEPDRPEAVRALVYRGSSDVGSIVEVHNRGDELEVWIDGSLVERIVAEKAFEPTQRPVMFSIDGFEFDESFAASPEALQALAAFREEGGEPPWEHAAELLADGLVNVHFDATPRGLRALASFAQPARSRGRESWPRGDHRSSV